MAKRQDLIRHAERQVQRGKLNAAIESYLQVLEEAPDDTTTLNRVGDLYARLQRIGEATELFERAAAHFSDEGFYVKAIAIYKKILRLDPGRLETAENLADLQARQGLVPEARQQYLEVAEGYRRRNDLESATAVHRKLVQVEPDDPSHRLRLAELLEQLGQPLEAMPHYGAIAQLMLEHGKVEDALKVCRQAFALDHSNLNFVSSFVDDLERHGFEAEAEEFVAFAAEANPEAARILAEADQDEASEALGDEPDAGLEVEVPVEDQVDVVEEEGTVSESLPEPESEEELEFEIELEDFHTVLAEDRVSEGLEDLREKMIEADVLTRYGLEDKAIEKLEEIVLSVPGHVEAHSKLLDLHLDHSNLDRAAEVAMILRDLIAAEGQPEEWDGWLERLSAEGFRIEGHSVVAPERPEKEMPTAIETSAVEPTSEQDLAWLDEADRAAGDVPAGDAVFAGEEEFFDLASELEKELGEEDLLDDDLLSPPEEQSLEEIVEGFKKGMAETLSAEDYDTHYNLGIAYREMGLIGEAISEFQLAAKDHRYLVDCCSLLASCFIEKGFPELAIKWYNEGLSSPIITEEETLGLVYELGDLYLSMGEEQEARLRFAEIYGVNSDYRDVSSKLAQLDQS